MPKFLLPTCESLFVNFHADNTEASGVPPDRGSTLRSAPLSTADAVSHPGDSSKTSEEGVSSGQGFMPGEPFSPMTAVLFLEPPNLNDQANGVVSSPDKKSEESVSGDRCVFQQLLNLNIFTAPRFCHKCHL